MPCYEMTMMKSKTLYSVAVKTMKKEKVMAAKLHRKDPYLQRSCKKIPSLMKRTGGGVAAHGTVALYLYA